MARPELWRAALDRYGTEPVAREMLAAHPGRVAVMASTDEVALGVLAAAARSGRRVPEDCAVVGCDGIPEGRLTRPPLTTVAEPIDRLCAAALDHVLGDAAGGPTDEAGELRVGGTCGCSGRARRLPFARCVPPAFVRPARPRAARPPVRPPWCRPPSRGPPVVARPAPPLCGPPARVLARPRAAVRRTPPC